MKRIYLPIFSILLSFLFCACQNSAGGGENQNRVKTVLPKTTVDEINEIFIKDKSRFADFCSGKTIVVTGEFVSIDDNKNESVAVVKSGATGATINVVFKNFNTERFYQMEDNQKVVVQGKCETTAGGFVINGTNMLLAKEDAPKMPENQNAENENQNPTKK